MFEYWIRTDLKRMPEVKTLNGRHFSQDEDANKIGVEVTDGGSPVTLEGTVTANIVRADGTTVTVSGSKSQNKAWVVLPASAYSVVGKVGIFLKLTNGTQVTTLGALEAYVYKTA